MTSEAETITRDGTANTATLWADLQTLWTQYQSWQNHDRLFADSQDPLSEVSSSTAKELQALLGNSNDLEVAGQHLQAALTERLNELNHPSRQAKLTTEQQQELTQIRTRLEREMELRSLGSPDFDRER